jgi:hypothetical protein
MVVESADVQRRLPLIEHGELHRRPATVKSNFKLHFRSSRSSLQSQTENPRADARGKICLCDGLYVSAQRYYIRARYTAATPF